jgi:hypothetical protein
MEITTMARINIIATWVGILATYVVVFGSLEHAIRTDPVGRVEYAHAAVHGVVISPFH